MHCTTHCPTMLSIQNTLILYKPHIQYRGERERARGINRRSFSPASHGLGQRLARAGPTAGHALAVHTRPLCLEISSRYVYGLLEWRWRAAL